MFHQVKVAGPDCDALRFLWWPDGDMSREPEDYCMTVHLFGATSSPSCAFYALRSADDQKDAYGNGVVSTVKRNFYADELLKSVGFEVEAISLPSELRFLLSNRGFRLTKWLSNSKAVLELAPSIVSLRLDGEPAE